MHPFRVLRRHAAWTRLAGAESDPRPVLTEHGKWTRSELVDLLKLHNAIAPITSGRSEGDLGLDEPFAMPFITIESLLVPDARHLLIANDNNYPYSVGRHLESNQPDDTELVLIELPQPL